MNHMVRRNQEIVLINLRGTTLEYELMFVLCEDTPPKKSSKNRRKSEERRHWSPTEIQRLKESFWHYSSWEEISRYVGNDRSAPECCNKWEDLQTRRAPHTFSEEPEDKIDKKYEKDRNPPSLSVTNKVDQCCCTSPQKGPEKSLFRWPKANHRIRDGDYRYRT